MKIGNKIYYKLFYTSLNIQIEEAEKDLKIFENSLSSIKNLLISYEPYVRTQTSVNFDFLMKRPSTKINGRLNERYVEKDVLYTKEAFLLYLKTYKSNLKKYNKAKEQHQSLVNQKIDYKTYSLIIKKFNLKISWLIVFKQYVFDLGYGLGKLSAKRVIVNKPGINWQESEKKKELLIKQGLEPYEKEKELKAKEEGREYNGVEWIVLHNPENVWIVHTYTNIITYKFQLIKSNVSESLRYYINELRRQKDFNPKAYPLK